MAQVYELADNRFLAVDMLEIVTFSDTTSDFESVLGELYRLENQNVAYEHLDSKLARTYVAKSKATLTRNLYCCT